jgi:hypothetical protein
VAASCDPVIDHDGDPPRNVGAPALSEIALPPPFDLGKLGVANRVEFRLLDAGKRDDLIVADHQRIAGIRDCTHCQFGLVRNADLAEENEIERCVEGRRDLCGDRHPATGKRQDNGVLRAVMHERCGQLSSCMRLLLKGIPI